MRGGFSEGLQAGDRGEEVAFAGEEVFLGKREEVTRGSFFSVRRGFFFFLERNQREGTEGCSLKTPS